MNFKVYVILAFSLFWSAPIQENPDLIGKWQLVYFDGIEQIRQSSRYRNAPAEAKQDMEYRIANRLENTVYEFMEEDSLVFTDYGQKGIVQKRVKFEVGEDQVLHIFEENQTRKAKIIELTENRLVLEPISESGVLGKLIFEPWVKPEE
ncbi:lipocalin family protein [Algoriphagus hitonicola]|uniref:Lipocalin-like domain-containing protein n=1 Tax=Algoriphagus hitonicola TaxID=435880 RepID=A0A1I2P427_9BACT|nr:lipocalin family protein [Algoriphagus hitonicola]SFG08211.1 Lipocalin-like domain-containing protein [Algoriphagus hitonicola]